MSESWPLNELGATPPDTTPARLAATHMTSHPRTTENRETVHWPEYRGTTNRPGSTCQQDCCKLGNGTTSVQHTPPLLPSNWMPQSSGSMGQGGWVSKFLPLRTLEAKWHHYHSAKILGALSCTNDRPTPRPAKLYWLIHLVQTTQILSQCLVMSARPEECMLHDIVT